MHETSTPTTVLLAGGGTGGHISPALAVAERLAEAGGPHPIFACSERTIDARMLEAAGADFVRLPALPPSAHPARLARFAVAFRRSRARCGEIIRRRRAGAVLALGGFVAAPAASAARAAGVPLLLLNLDDPPGRANRWIARRADHVYTAIELPDRPGFAEAVVGLPLRSAARARGDAATCRRALELDPDRPVLLVTGASQGAQSLNDLVPALAARAADAFGGWQVLHLAGLGAADRVRAAYEAAGVGARVVPFLDEIGLAWGAAELAVSRAGANSVAEVEANAVPTLFLPYPHHRDMHQRRNAARLERAGAAVIAVDRANVAANLGDAGAVLLDLMHAPARRRALRDRLREHPPPDAARRIADLLVTATARP